MHHIVGWDDDKHQSALIGRWLIARLCFLRAASWRILTCNWNSAGLLENVLTAGRMLQEISACSVDILYCGMLHLLNDIWISGNFPESWRTSTIIPVLKAGKDESDPSSYRPVALTSCICKIMERMINDRLVWYLEKHKLLTPVQCGLRKNHSTTDQLVRLEKFVREAFIQRQHAVAVFFNLEKAYDTTWKYGIIRDLHRAADCRRWLKVFFKTGTSKWVSVHVSLRFMIWKWVFRNAVFFLSLCLVCFPPVLNALFMWMISWSAIALKTSTLLRGIFNNA